MKLLKFGAEWCAPCRTMEQRLADFDACEIERYDIDGDDEKTLDLIETYKIKSIPTMILVDNDNKTLATWHGSVMVNEIVDEINKHK